MEIAKRYKRMQYTEALTRSLLYYPTVCKELHLILREAYHLLPKTVQSLIFSDILSTFRFLPEVHTQSAVSAAHLLLQSAEATFPKQKKNSVVSEFKHAMIAQKRRSRVHKAEESIAELPADILVHIFGSLDLQSLVSASLVCWSWNLAASDNQLWQSRYAIYFGDIDSLRTQELQNVRLHEHMELFDSQKNLFTGTLIDWKEVFRKEYAGKRFASNRGYCSLCKLVWLDNMKCCNEGVQNHYVTFDGEGVQNHNVTFMSSHQVVDYLLHDSSPTSDGNGDSDSYSDSDSEYEDIAPWCYSSEMGM